MKTNKLLFIGSFGKDVGHLQGSHRLEKYLNIQDCLERSLKFKFALKTLKGLEKSLNFYH